MANTRENLVRTAMRLFAEKGYGSTSIADILNTAGVNSGSLYHFFPGKQDLLVAVLDAYLQGIDEMLLQPAWDGVEDPVERVFSLLASYRELLVTSDFFYGCPIGSLALELHEPDPAVRVALEANFTAWREAVADCISEAAKQKDVSVDADALATTVLAVMEGGVMLSRTYRDATLHDTTVVELRHLFERAGLIGG
jgi:TetR/AcrR family transcriptional repressor of nem operon